MSTETVSTTPTHDSGTPLGVGSSDYLVVFLQVLNEAYAADPAAIHALICNRVPCNQALADHPTIQVEVNRVAAGESYAVGMLGVINGLVEATTGERVAVMWSDDDKGRCLGFTRYAPNTA